MSLAETFLSNADTSIVEAGVPRDELEAVLARAIASAQRAWPTVVVPTEAFVAHVARHVESAKALATLRALHAADLYLALACGRGDHAAIGVFERTFMSAVPGVVARVLKTGAVDDVVQSVRTRLLLKTEDASPKILDYSGHGALAGWLRVTAVRMALNTTRSARPDAPAGGFDEALFEIESPERSPELAAIRERHRDDFKAAFQEAVGALAPDRRNVLRLRFVEGLTIDQLANAFDVHRATAARWIAEARDDVYERTRQLLLERLSLTPSEFESLVDVVLSDLDMSVQRILMIGAP